MIEVPKNRTVIVNSEFASQKLVLAMEPEMFKYTIKFLQDAQSLGQSIIGHFEQEHHYECTQFNQEISYFLTLSFLYLLLSLFAIRACSCENVRGSLLC